MTCKESVRAMLSVERAELRGEGDSALAVHVRSCPACARRAALLESTSSLLATTITAHSPGRKRERQFSAPKRLRRRIGLSLLPLAAAAVAVLLVRRDSGGPAATGAKHATASVLSVEVTRGQTATVIKTRDPNVTIVWLTRGGKK